MTRHDAIEYFSRYTLRWEFRLLEFVIEWRTTFAESHGSHKRYEFNKELFGGLSWVEIFSHRDT